MELWLWLWSIKHQKIYIVRLVIGRSLIINKNTNNKNPLTLIAFAQHQIPMGEAEKGMLGGDVDGMQQHERFLVSKVGRIFVESLLCAKKNDTTMK